MSKYDAASKYTRCVWAGGVFFSSCAVVSVFGLWQEIDFGVTYLRI
jgi:hypothetical protein